MKFADSRMTTAIDESQEIAPSLKAPALLVAYTPKGCCTVDRCRIPLPSFIIGRLGSNDLSIRDRKMSQIHFRIYSTSDGFLIDDLGSTNGTFVNGERITKATLISKGAVIRAGNSVLVFEPDGDSVLAQPPIRRYGMSGAFYVSSIVDQLRDAVLDGRHILIVGETGVGKELAVHAIADIMRKSNSNLSILEHNCAHFGSLDEANTTLWGLENKVYTDVDHRIGLIEQAGDGVLLLDEAHCLPPLAQKSLLRLVENNQYKRIGDSKYRTSRARIVLISNEVSLPYAGLVHDLYPRLRVVRIPPLSERVADIPTIFNKLLKDCLEELSVTTHYYAEHIKVRHFEMMCLSGLRLTDRRPLNDNVRGLKDVAKQLATSAARGKDPATPVNDVFYERFCADSCEEQAPKPVTPQRRPPETPPKRTQMNASSLISKRISHYDLNKDFIIQTYFNCGQRLTLTVKTLKKAGMKCCRQRLSDYLKKWGVRK